MPQTFTPIQSTTLGSAQGTVTFSSIPQTYTDLVIISTPIFATAGQMITNFNSDTGTNYSITYLLGDGTSASSSRFSSITSIGTTPTQTSTANINIIQHILNYSNTTTYKTMLQRINKPAENTWASVGLWRSTAAITSIVLTGNSANFASGSTFTLYGILKA